MNNKVKNVLIKKDGVEFGAPDGMRYFAKKDGNSILIFKKVGDEVWSYKTQLFITGKITAQKIWDKLS